MGKLWKQWETIFLGSKITAGGDCSHEIKRCLLLGRKAMTNLNSVLKSRDISLPTKVRIVKGMGLSSSHVWMWELDQKEGWASKNWCFWTVVLEKTLEKTASRSNQSILKEISPEYSLEGLMLKLKLQLWPPDAKNWLIWKDPDAGKDWRQEEKGTTGWDGWMASPTQRTWVWVNSSSWWWTGMPGVLQSMGSQRVGNDWATELNKKRA